MKEAEAWDLYRKPSNVAVSFRQHLINNSSKNKNKNINLVLQSKENDMKRAGSELLMNHSLSLMTVIETPKTNITERRPWCETLYKQDQKRLCLGMFPKDTKKKVISIWSPSNPELMAVTSHHTSKGRYVQCKVKGLLRNIYNKRVDEAFVSSKIRPKM